MGPDVSENAEEGVHDKEAGNQDDALADRREEDGPAGFFRGLQAGDGNIVEADNGSGENQNVHHLSPQIQGRCLLQEELYNQVSAKFTEDQSDNSQKNR